ncbi:hypothetical protein I4U23_012442 [Adineta vaga]|nr:hypothetical protein I4U23_012442 [Adineta vaga]
MSYSLDDDHDEDDLPVISIPKTIREVRKTYDQDEAENDYSTRLIGNWQRLYETSVQSLHSDDDGEESTIQKPFYIDRPIQIETPSQREIPPPPPIYQHEVESNISNSRWQIRLPDLLNRTVGPDRQNQNKLRRHTTAVVFQVSNPHNSEFNPPHLNPIQNEQPFSPIFSQLKQKFESMSKSSLQSPINNSPRLPRVWSSMDIRQNIDTKKPFNRTPRSALPVRPSPELIPSKPRTASVGIIPSRPMTTNGRVPRERTNPPVSYSKHFYPPPSTTSVVKQLIGGGATLVYDSISSSSSKNTSQQNSPRFKHQRNIEKRTQDILDSSRILTGRQLPSDSASDTYATIKPKNSDKRTWNKPMEDDSEGIYEDPEFYEPSINSSEPRSSRNPTTPARNAQKNLSDDEHEDYYPTYNFNGMKK